MNRNIINIINFIRAVEPRDDKADLVEPVIQQLKLINDHNLPATFLLQYDALIAGPYTQLLKENLSADSEIGIWLEIVQPLVEKAGLKWRGREGWAWDYHSDKGFSVGYTPAEREKFIDIIMDDFYNIFGYYPKSVGSWIIDIRTLSYLYDKYHIVASCNCKEQWGTDGYTLWGGYYGQAYYPSRMNALSPAQTKELQLDLPIFRMLGSDPIYQYDCGKRYDDNNTEINQSVITLEPVYKRGGGGGDDAWVDWYLKENYDNPCISFAYSQAGQENSFTWPSMSHGLTYQMNVIANMRDSGKLSVETLSESGMAYAKAYELTPASAIIALSDWKNTGSRSVWYCSRFYRANLMWQNGSLRFRDIHKFDEKYAERYINDTCKSRLLKYDTLPVIDGNIWSGSIESGMKMYINEQPIKCSTPSIIEGKDSLCILVHDESSDENMEIQLDEKTISVTMQVSNWYLMMEWSEIYNNSFVSAENSSLSYRHNDFEYKINLTKGSVKMKNRHTVVLTPDDGKLVINMLS